MISNDPTCGRQARVTNKGATMVENLIANHTAPVDGEPTPSYGIAGLGPSSESSELALRRVAIRRLKAKRDFRSHLFVFIVLNIAFWAGWAIDGVINEFEFPWPLFPTFIWGLFVIGHAYDVYWNDPLREELVQQEIEKLRAVTSVHPLAAFDLDDDEEWC
ncbi:MAG: 2TM domain-containing protein [Acidimicrobiia bacterium]|nr:2TM domain-containing protein [Acidimicrobiia bacterium]